MTYKIETNVKPRPKFKYPFDDLEIDESFVVPSTDQRPKPWKQMGSTILWANRRFAPKSFRIQKSDEPLGARIWRIDDQAVKGQTEAPKPEPVKVKPKPKPVEVKPEPVEVKSTEVEMASVTELNECVELTRCSYDKMIARMNQAIDDYTEGVVTEHLHIYLSQCRNTR